MLKISKENIDSFLGTILDTKHETEEETIQFWDRLEKDNEELMDLIIGFAENLETDIERTMFLDGFWMMYCLVERELNLKDLENLNI